MTSNAISNASPTDPDAEVPSGRSLVALLDSLRATGDTAPGGVSSRLLDERRVGNAVSLAKLVQTEQVFGVQWLSCFWMPTFQFNAHDFAVKGGAQLAGAAFSASWSGWTAVSWFATASAKLQGCTPAAALDSDLEAVLRLADSYSSCEAGEPVFLSGRRPQTEVSHV